MLGNGINRNCEYKSGYSLNFQMFNNNALISNLIDKVHIFGFKPKILIVNVGNFLIQFYNVFNSFNNNVLTLLCNSK